MNNPEKFDELHEKLLNYYPNNSNDIVDILHLITFINIIELNSIILPEENKNNFLNEIYESFTEEHKALKDMYLYLKSETEKMTRESAIAMINIENQVNKIFNNDSKRI